MIAVATLLLASFASTSMAADVPESIHIALGHTPDYMSVQWSIYNSLCTSVVNTVQFYDVRGIIKHSAVADCSPFDLGGTQLIVSNFVAKLNGLQASTTYKYRIGDGKTWSDEFSFTTAPDAASLGKSLPHRFLVFGDLASSAAAPDRTTTIMPWASKEVIDGHFDMILHVGDFAYNLQDDNGERGRLFMNEISNMSSIVPYMVDAGNHESGYGFAHYTEYFRSQPSNLEVVNASTDNGLAPNNWFFSWNYGLVHFVTLASEIWYHDDLTGVLASQYDWLKADLEKANANRTAAPWIIVNAHRGPYCSCDGDCDADATRMRAGIKQTDGTYKYGVESLLYQYGVDLWINGHEHNYERMYDIAPLETYTRNAGVTTQSTFNPPATTYIVTGDAGNDENHEVFIYPQPSRTAYRTSAYGYSRMIVHNSTHLYWDQVECDDSVVPHVDGEVVDSFWLVQEKHGSFIR